MITERQLKEMRIMYVVRHINAGSERSPAYLRWYREWVDLLDAAQQAAAKAANKTTGARDDKYTFNWRR